MSSPGDTKVDMALVEKVARVIREADALMIHTGAGMGVYSGLGTFRGKAAGIWPPLKTLGIDFTQMSNPRWFEKPFGKTSDTVNFGWAFWRFRYDAYTKNEPHEGYHILKNWAAKKKFGGFSFTSNIDGHWHACGFPEDRILEIHGSVRHMQCHTKKSAKCKREIWDTEGLDFDIDEETNCALEPLPTCKHCGDRARPNVLMFGDWGYISTRTDVQEENYNKWVEELDAHNAKIAIIEIGAGTAVPSVRMQSEHWCSEFKDGNCTLLRFNPEAPSIPASLMRTGRHMSITEDALAVLKAVDKLLSKEDGKEAAATVKESAETKAEATKR